MSTSGSGKRREGRDPLRGRDPGGAHACSSPPEQVTNRRARPIATGSQFLSRTLPTTGPVVLTTALLVPTTGPVVLTTALLVPIAGPVVLNAAPLVPTAG